MRNRRHCSHMEILDAYLDHPAPPTDETERPSPGVDRERSLREYADNAADIDKWIDSPERCLARLNLG